MCIKYLFAALFLNSFQTTPFSLIWISLWLAAVMTSSLCVSVGSLSGNHKHFWVNLCWTIYVMELNSRCGTAVERLMFKTRTEGVFSCVRFKLRITLVGAGCKFAATVPLFSTASVQSLTKRGTVLLSLSQSISRRQPNTWSEGWWQTNTNTHTHTHTHTHKHTFYVSSEVVFFFFPKITVPRHDVRSTSSS